VFLQEAMSMLKEMYFRGGIEVCTTWDEKSETGLSLCAWTLIQPDGDLINKISEKVLSHHEIWARHLEKVEEKMGIVRRFRMLLKLASASSIPPLIFAGYSILSSAEKTFSGIWAHAAVFLAGLLLFLLRPFIGILLRWYMRKLIKFGGQS
jgi:hypothetical protein